MSTKLLGKLPIALTVVYLIFEFALNARILDVTSSTSSADLEGVELWGRVLFGVACSLVTWKTLANHSALSTRLAFCVIAGSVAFIAQKLFIDQLVASSSPEFRRQSVQLALTVRQVPTGVVTFEQIPLKGNDWNQADGKVFLALLPAFVFSSNEFAQSIEKALPALTAQQIRESLGNPNEVYRRTTSDLKSKLSDEYDKYTRAGTGNQLAATPEQGWSEYQRRLESVGINPLRPTAKQRTQVLEQLRSSNLLLPENWPLYDQKQFVLAWEERAQRLESPDTANTKQPPPAIESGLTLRDFAQHPEVQRRIREQLLAKGLHPDSSTIDPDMSPENFNARLYEPTVSTEVRKQLIDLTAPAQDFANDGRLVQLGSDAARKSLIPPVAIAFSMAGALLNFLGLCITLAKWVATRSKVLGATTAAICFILMVGMVMAAQSRVAESKPYELLLASLRIGTVETLVLSWILDLTVRIEPTVYAVGNWLRQFLLGGYMFS